MWPNDPEARVATAFNRHYPDESNARNLMQRRQEILDDVTDTVGATFLAMTYGCARCHTHKFDPILHTDYYRLQAFFANTAADDEIPMIGPEQMAQYRARKAAWEEKTKPVRDQIAALLEPKKQSILKEFVDKYPQEIQDVIAKPAAERNPFEWQMYYKAKPYLSIDDKTLLPALKGEDKKKYRGADGRIEEVRRSRSGRSAPRHRDARSERQGSANAPFGRRVLGCAARRSPAWVSIDHRSEPAEDRTTARRQFNGPADSAGQLAREP